MSTKNNMSNANYRDFTLLVDGRNAFPEILSCIKQAKKSIYINMFIWRDDAIGNKIAKALLDAADRGVDVEISVDRYGVVLEKSEESKKSFFHKKQTLAEKIKIKALELLYPMHGAPKKASDEETELYKQIMSHPRISVSRDAFKADHSKYYIIDGEILFLGGINIEDKENGADMQGRVYQDYMVKISGCEYVNAFLKKLETGKHTNETYDFGINRKTLSPKLFEMEERYLDLICNAKQELYINMAYFSPLPRFLDAIALAHERGVRVTVMVPEYANYQNDTNRKTAKLLMKRTNNGISLYFTPKMAHTKLVANEEWISLGSTNITKKAFAQLDELNLFVKNESNEFRDDLFASMNENYAIAKRINNEKEIRYNPILAFLEGFLV